MNVTASSKLATARGQLEFNTNQYLCEKKLTGLSFVDVGTTV